ncbi:MAG TPA: cobyrinate a,c-diamide synthase [Desulfuromonadales bacterium]|nr:cobyrinate a,c-diamide synthase [Desulfuromonadales bacterium]
MRTLIVAAPASGSGKTTVTLALLAALHRRGLAVAPFKVGPDFIDPGHHAAVCGRSSRNLDGWLCGERGVRETFGRGCLGAEVAVVEGVMGLFDGAAGDSDAGSTAEIARWLGGRILLVVDARSQARSAAALVQGFSRFDPRLEFAGVIFNRVGSPRHAELLRDALASVPGLPPLLGCLPREEELALPERHLGLVTAGETEPDEDFYGRLADWLEGHVDVEALVLPPPLPKQARCQVYTFDKTGKCVDLTPKVRIAVARDEAFCFCYPENLELLEAAGAEIVPFSPLHDQALPAGTDGLYLPGGYPELHAGRLAQNVGLLREIREAAVAGLPVYAECGGFMLLAESIDGRSMAGVFPARVRMLTKRKALGYRQVTFARDTILGPAGTVARGHEFHYSETEMPVEVARCYRLFRPGGEDLGPEGYRVHNVLGSYVHLHFGSNPGLAAAFVENCKKYKDN